jgi:hypothetical protein
MLAGKTETEAETETETETVDTRMIYAERYSVDVTVTPLFSFDNTSYLQLSEILRSCLQRLVDLVDMHSIANTGRSLATSLSAHNTRNR